MSASEVIHDWSAPAASPICCELLYACRHQDMAYWPPFTSDTATATCWLAVSEATEKNGCMRFVAGSHKEAELRPHAPGASMQSFDFP